jgi:pimeloyl-ACP methyl ester carboxylesterase
MMLQRRSTAARSAAARSTAAARSAAAARFTAALVSLALLGGCSLPVGVRRVDPRNVHRTLTGGVLTTGTLSAPTQNVLFRWGLGEIASTHAEVALGVLHAALLEERAGQDEIFALAELSFAHAEHTGLGSYYLAAVVYAYLFLFPEDWNDNPNPFDARLRVAADLYNRAITAGLAARDRHVVAIESQTYALPFGTLEVEFDPATLRWGNRLLTDFVPVAELSVHGMRTRYRWPGLGAPLAAGTGPLEPGKEFDDFVEPWVKVPVSAVVRMDRLREQIATGHIRAALELEFPQQTESIVVEGRYLPLEVESTATLAYMLAESPVWAQEIAGFLKGFGVINEKSQLAALAPYRTGRIPVVLVHGTASSSGRWAQMLNELVNDPRIRGRFQFWLFSYNTGNPIAYSAMLLRDSLTAAVERLDPEHRDPALRNMVVIGHSQGGLLTKLTAIDSGSAFWDAISRRPLTQLTLSERTRVLLERAVFVKPPATASATGSPASSRSRSTSCTSGPISWSATARRWTSPASDIFRARWRT